VRSYWRQQAAGARRDQISIRRSYYPIRFAPNSRIRGPEQILAIIIEALSPVAFDDEALDWPAGGYVRLTCIDGREIAIVFYEGGHNPLTFSLNGARYRRDGVYVRDEDGYWVDESLTLEQLLKDAYSESTGTAVNRKEIERSINYLRKSAGHVP